LQVDNDEPAGLMVAYEVSTRVNSVKNNEPSLIEPVAELGRRPWRRTSLTHAPSARGRF
jgi:hypothetical protein